MSVIEPYDLYEGEDPAVGAFTITASADPLAYQCRAIYVGTGGNVTLTTTRGQSVQFTNVPSGSILPVRCTHVTAASASGIVGLY